MPFVPTPLQSEASRRNGSLSRGPISEAGKAISARNATRHGLRAGGISVRPEESDWYAALLAAHLQLYAPGNAAERGLVEQLCVVELKLARLDLLELAALEPAAEGKSGNARALPSLSTLTRYRSRITKERWELEHRLSQLQQRRETQSAAAAGTRGEPRQGAPTSPLSPEDTGGTNEPEPVRGPIGTSEPERAAAGRPLNRRQRRLLARMARREAVSARGAEAA